MRRRDLLAGVGAAAVVGLPTDKAMSAVGSVEVIENTDPLLVAVYIDREELTTDDEYQMCESLKQLRKEHDLPPIVLVKRGVSIESVSSKQDVSESYEKELFFPDITGTSSISINVRDSQGRSNGYVNVQMVRSNDPENETKRKAALREALQTLVELL